MDQPPVKGKKFQIGSGGKRKIDGVGGRTPHQTDTAARASFDRKEIPVNLFPSVSGSADDSDHSRQDYVGGLVAGGHHPNTSAAISDDVHPCQDYATDQLEYSTGINWTYAQELGFQNEIITLLREGYAPQIAEHSRSHFKNNQSVLQNAIRVDTQISELLKRDRIEQAKTNSRQFGHDVNPLTLVIKGDKDRLCIDTSRVVNKVIPSLPFKMYGIHHRLRQLKAGTWVAKIDLKNGYLHIPIHKDYRKYLAFSWRGKLYRYKWLPFGINDAPRVFQSIMNELTDSLQRSGHFVETYLDDFWIQGDSFEQCQAALKETLIRLEKLGFTVNKKKSVLKPTQRIDYLGVEFDTLKGIATLKPSQKANWKLQLHKAIKTSTARQWRKLLGIGASFTTIDCRIKPYLMSAYKSVGNYQREEEVHLSRSALQDLHTITSHLDNIRFMTSNNFARLTTITSDASGTGFGFWDDYTNQTTSGLWNKSAGQHSTHTELLSAKYAIQAFEQKNHFLLLKSDNTSTVGCLNKGSSKSLALNKIVKDLCNWALTRGIYYAASYIPGESNIRADLASRQKATVGTGEFMANSLLASTYAKTTPPGSSSLSLQQHLPSVITLSQYETNYKPFHSIIRLDHVFITSFIDSKELLISDRKYWRKKHNSRIVVNARPLTVKGPSGSFVS